MAIIYFTNNADSGSGSLRAAVTNAKDGDVILPDETVFGRGASIEISLASRLDVRKTLTIDGDASRIRLNGGSSVVCLYVREGDATIINVDVVAGRSASTSSFYPGGVRVDASATFKRCRIAGCESQTTGGAMFIASGGVANLVDCLAVGNRSAAGFGGLAVGGFANVAGSTLVGNLAATGANDVGGAGTVDLTNAIVGVNAAEKTTSSGSVVGVAASQIGFVAPPPDDLTSEDWTEELWQSWDLRLLDDASDAPSPYRDSGDVDKMTQYDFDGNFRGRETNGAATCSPGAYETLQADLFWVGRDATGAQVVSPSFLTSDGWASSRFADATGDAAPQLGQTLFVGDSVAFVDAAPQGAAFIVGGGASVSTGASSATTATALTLGRGATYNVATTVRAVRFAEESRVVLAGGALIFDAASSTADAANPLSCVDWTGGCLTFAASTFAFDALTVPTGATLAVDGGRVSAETLTLAAGTTVVFLGIDPVLSATETVSVADGAVLNGLGYVAAPSVDAFASAIVGDDVRVCRNGADVQTFTVKSNGKNVVCRWEALDLTTPVLIESRVDERWIVENGEALDGETEFIFHASGDATFRVFDGEKFLQKSVFIAPFHAWLTYDNLFTSAIVVKSYTVVTEHILMSVYFNAGEAPVLLARVADSLTNVAVTTDDVESISLTVYKMQLYRGVKRRTALEGWVDVDVPITAVMEELIADDPRWKKDSVGYNFRYEPDLREKSLFNESGEYVVVVTIKFKEGNPAPLVFNVSVK